MHYTVRVTEAIHSVQFSLVQFSSVQFRITIFHKLLFYLAVSYMSYSLNFFVGSVITVKQIKYGEDGGLDYYLIRNVIVVWFEHITCKGLC